MSDYIRREDAIKTIKENDVCCYCSNTKVLAEIRNLPAIDLKRGEWTEVKGGWKCTACDKWASFASDFCPNCGAKMNLK